jgi:hypothetical protein
LRQETILLTGDGEAGERGKAWQSPENTGGTGGEEPLTGFPVGAKEELDANRFIIISFPVFRPAA